MASVSLAFALSIMGVRDVRAGMDDVGDGADNTASRLSALGAAGVAAAGLLAGAFGAGLVSALDIEPAIDKMNAGLGATGQFAKDLGGIAGNLYADAYGESMGDVTAAIESVWKSGAIMEDATNAEIESVTATAMDLAAVMGEEVGPLMKAVGQMVKTGLADNAQEAFDILARGQQQGLNASEDLLDTFNEYGTQFRKLGLDGQTALGLISQGLRGGARDADLVADAIKEFSIRAIDGSEGTAEGFKSIGLNAGEMAAKIAAGGPAAAGALDLTLDKLNAIADPVARNAAGVALFGTQWEDMGAAMQSLDVSSAAKSLGDVDGAAARMGETLNDNAKTNLVEFKRQAEMALVNLLGGQVIPAITKATGWLSDNFGPALSMVAGWAAAAGRGLEAFGGWLADNETTVKIVAGIITGVLLPSLVMLGVQATISAAKQVAAWVTTGAAATGSAAVQVGALVASGAKWVWAGWMAVGSAAKQIGVWLAIGAISVAQGALSLVSLALLGAKWVWAGAMATASAIRMAAAWVIGLGPIAWVVAAVAAAVALIIKYWDDIVKGLKIAGQAIANFFTALPGWILGFLATAGQWLVDAGRRILSGLWGGIKWWWDNVIVRFYWDLPRMILGFFATAASWLFQKGKDILTGLMNGLWNVASGIVGWLWRNIHGPILGFFAGAGRWLWQKGDDIIRGMVSGMWGVLAGIGGWLKRNVYDRIVDGIKSLFGINSPSTVMAGLGVHLIEGLLRGIVFSSRNVGAVVKKALGGIVDAAGGIFGLIGGAGGKLFDIIFGGDGGGKIGRIAGGVQRWAGIASAVLAELGQSQRWLPTLLRRMNQESGGNPRAINLNDINAKRGDPSRGLMQTIGCVPLETDILTERGWLKHDEVRVGDRTIGYNPETGRAEWTKILRVVHYDDAEVIRIGNKKWSAEVTAEHRWWSDTLVDTQEEFTHCPECGWEPRGKKKPSRGVQVHRNKIHGLANPVTRTKLRGEFVRTGELRHGHRLRLAAEADTNGIPGLSIEDVRVIAWLQGDGNIIETSRRTYDDLPMSCWLCGWHDVMRREPGEAASREGLTHPGRSHPGLLVHLGKVHGVKWEAPADRGAEKVFDATIYQAKPDMVVKIRALLAYIEHKEYVRPPRNSRCLPAHEFKLRREYVTDLLKRSEAMETGPEAFVLRLSPDQRAAWLDSIIDAEGHRMAGKKPEHSEFVRIAQVDGPLQDAIKLAVYLEGWRPTYSANSAERNGYKPAGVVGMARPHTAPSMFEPPVAVGRQSVFCLVTDLGTWTMRQNGLPCLTGNSTFNAYAGKYAGRGIYDPYANIYAATRYTLARYGTLAAWNRPGGYDQGGWLQPGWTLAVNNTGEPELITPMNKLRRGDGGGDTHYHVHLHGTVVLGGSRDRAGKELRDLFRDSLRGDGKHEAAAML